MPGEQLVSHPLTLILAVAAIFIWLIPLWHAVRSGSVLATVEVLVLLALGVAGPLMMLALTRGGGGLQTVLGTLGALQALGGGIMLWLGALLIALASDLGREFRRAERRREYAAPVAAEQVRRHDPRI